MTPGRSPDEEIRRFDEQVRRNPHSLVFARLADAHRKAGNPERALEILARGIERHADYPSAHVVRARAFRDLGRIDEAVASFETVLELDAENLVALRALAEMAEERGDAETARATYGRLLALDPSASEAGVPAPAEPEVPAEEREEEAELLDVHEIAEAIGATGAMRETEAEGEAEEYEPSPDADMLTRTMAELYASQGLFEEAAEIYVELLKDTPGDEELRGRLDSLREKLTGEPPAPAPPAPETAAAPVREGPAWDTIDPGGTDVDTAAPPEGLDSPSGSGPQDEEPPRSAVLERWLRRLKD